MINPTELQYTSFNQAYQHFNRTLFADGLPNCLITMQRHKGAYCYFSPNRFSNHTHKTDEIAMNPLHFRGERTVEKVLSTLAHEMVHLWQQHNGKPGRGGYHNKQWGDEMRRIGLEPSSTGTPGGKTTGQKVSHYVVADGPFAIACAQVISEGFELHYADTSATSPKAAKKAASKTKYSCPACSANAWAKPNTSLVCGECSEAMQAD